MSILEPSKTPLLLCEAADWLEQSPPPQGKPPIVPINKMLRDAANEILRLEAELRVAYAMPFAIESAINKQGQH